MKNTEIYVHYCKKRALKREIKCFQTKKQKQINEQETKFPIK